MPLRLADLHPQALVLSGGEGEIGVDFGGKIGALQADFDRVVVALLGDGLGGGVGQGLEVLTQDFFGLLGGVTID